MKDVDMLLTNGIVVTMDKDRRIIENGAIAVNKGRILYVGTTTDAVERYSAAKVVDCEDHVVMPGFVDAHGHAGHGMIRGTVVDTSYWMPVLSHFYKNYTTPDFWYYEGRLNALDRLRSGITTGACVMGCQPINPDPAYAMNNAQAYCEVGVRDIVCTGFPSLPWPHRFSTWKNGEKTMRDYSFEEITRNTETVIKTLNHANNDRTRAFVCPFGILTSTDPSNPNPADRLRSLTEYDLLQAKVVRRIAKEYDTRIHTDAFQGSVWLAYQDKENALLGPDVHLQHCKELSIDEVRILADTGTNVTCMSSSGTPLIEILGFGINAACTTDGPKMIGATDMFSEMRMFRLAYNAKDKFLLPSEKILEMTTIDAAKAVGWDDEIGSLEAGKKADIITVNLMNTRCVPRVNLVNLLVMAVESHDIRDVFVDGQAMIENGVVQSVNEHQVLQDAQVEADRTVKRAGKLLEGFAHPNKMHWGEIKKYDGDDQHFDLDWSRRDGGYY